MLNHGIVPVGDTGGYEIDNSLRFNRADSAYLSRTPSSAGNRQKFTYSCWVKKSANSGRHLLFGCDSGDEVEDTLHIDLTNQNIRFDFDAVSQGASMKLRDNSAWYHIMLVADTTSASNLTASERIKIYVNNNRITDWAHNNGDPAIGYNFRINKASQHLIGSGKGDYLDGYLAEVNFVDGQAKSPSDFGETGDYGEWKPIKYTGTYGTNGFYLDFGNSGSLGADSSGNGNNWTPNNLAATDQMLDSPTNNFCTMNSASPNTQTLSEGGLKSTGNTGRSAVGTFPMISGKWYWEFYWTGGNNEVRIGLTDDASNGGYGGGIHAYSWTGNVANYLSGGNTNISCSPSITQNSIIGFAWDADAGELKAFVNGTAINSGAALLTGFTGYTMMPHGGQGAGGFTIWYNFGQDSSFAGNKTAQGNTDDNGYGDFYYEPPTGYLALCTQNLPDPDVIPSEHFNTVLWTGNGSSGNSITGVGFQPDFVWIKTRSYANNPYLYDAIRGTTKTLSSEGMAAEETKSGLTAFDSDGFTVGSWVGTNKSGDSHVAWNWKANGSDVLNENGTIDSQVSANTDAGFSIVSYTGNGTVSTVGHGLSSAPEMIVNKPRGLADNWNVYHKDVDSAGTGIIYLNKTNAGSSNAAFFNNTTPTNSLFTIGSVSGINQSGTGYINYCFHSVDGYSKVGSYTGNGSSDGTFVYTGFRPAYVMIRRSDSTEQWIILDSTRDTYNVTKARLFANLTNAEDTSENRIDILSNGFKPRNNVNDSNSSGGNYIYLAFAEHPFKYTNAR